MAEAGRAVNRGTIRALRPDDSNLEFPDEQAAVFSIPLTGRRPSSGLWR